jgi:hypothetical protein
MDAPDAVGKDRSHLWIAVFLFALALLCSAWFLAFDSTHCLRICGRWCLALPAGSG